MGAASPIMRGDFSISDLVRAAAERSITVNYLVEPGPQIETPTMSGILLAEEVQPGLLVSGFDLSYTADCSFDVEIDRSVSCAILLEGWGEALQIAGHPPIEHELGRVSIVGHGEPMTCRRPWREGQRTRAFGISLTPDFFGRFRQAIGDEDVQAFRAFLEPGLHSAMLPWSPTIVGIAEAALNGPYGGVLRALHREAQALRFMIEVGFALRAEQNLAGRIGRRQYDRVREACDILDRSLAAPPKVLDLARQLGVNVATLQANFKAALGTTVFGYLRNRRLEMGQVLIREHGLGVAEAGYRVGFNSAAAFTAAFRRYFGHPPSARQ
jgi:AraC-like DNA-binding protein